MDKENVKYYIYIYYIYIYIIYIYIIQPLRKEVNPVTYGNMDKHSMLSEISQTEKDKYYMYSIMYMWNLKKRKKKS